jgi:hypothetical protein
MILSGMRSWFLCGIGVAQLADVREIPCSAKLTAEDIYGAVYSSQADFE